MLLPKEKKIQADQRGESSHGQPQGCPGPNQGQTKTKESSDQHQQPKFKPRGELFQPVPSDHVQAGGRLDLHAGKNAQWGAEGVPLGPLSIWNRSLSHKHQLVGEHRSGRTASLQGLVIAFRGYSHAARTIIIDPTQSGWIPRNFVEHVGEFPGEAWILPVKTVPPHHRIFRGRNIRHPPIVRTKRPEGLLQLHQFVLTRKPSFDPASQNDFFMQADRFTQGLVHLRSGRKIHEHVKNDRFRLGRGESLQQLHMVGSVPSKVGILMKSHPRSLIHVDDDRLLDLGIRAKRQEQIIAPFGQPEARHGRGHSQAKQHGPDRADPSATLILR